MDGVPAGRSAGGMTARISLATEESSRALEILQQELQTFRPSRGQVLAYYLLHGEVAVFVISFAAFFFTQEGSTAREIATIILGFAALAMLPILLLNLKVVSRLWRAARMRQRLGLTEPLAAAFQAQRRKTWVFNTLTAALVGIGALFLIVAVVVPAATWNEIERSKAGAFFLALVIGLYVILGITLISLHYLRRGMERLAVVQGLRTTLGAVASDSPKEPASAVSVSPEDYDLIARIERDQIIRERYQNIARSKAGARTSGYVIQMGVEAQHGNSRLQASGRLL